MKVPKFQSMLSFFLTLFAVLLFIFTLTVYLYRMHCSGNLYGETDFFKFYQSIRFYFAGQDIYSPVITRMKFMTSIRWLTADGNLNPPFLAILLIPLYYFNYADALEVWTLLSILCLLASSLLLISAFPEFKKHRINTLYIITAFLLYLPNSVNLTYGQISAYILVLLIFAWLSARQRKDILAGIFIGLLCGIKLFCGLFLVYFFFMKRYRLLISASVTYGLTLITGLWIFGRIAYTHYHHILGHIGWYSASWNASLLGFFTRFFSSKEGNHALWQMPQLVYPLTLLFSGVILLYLFHAFFHLKKYAAATDAEDIGFSLVIIAMLLLSPLGWVYYFPFLAIAYFVLVFQSRYIKKGLLVHLFACVLLLLSTLSGDLLPTYAVKTTPQILANSGYGFYTLILFFILMLFVCHERLNTQFDKTLRADTVAHFLWIIIYSCMLTPSLISLFGIAQQLHFFNFQV